MPIFLLSFDLSHEDGLPYYEEFRKELTRFHAHRVLSNACLINVNTADPKRLVEILKPKTDDKDRLMATRMDPTSYWYLNTLPGTNDWLKENPPVALPAP